jgi:hypothetical protein
MKVSVFCEIAPYMQRRFVGTYDLYLQGRKSAEQGTSVLAGGQELYGAIAQRFNNDSPL